MKMEVNILGKNFGTAEGWDELDLLTLIFYDFEPNKEFENKIPSGDLAVFFDDNKITVSDEQEETYLSTIIEHFQSSPATAVT